MIHQNQDSFGLKTPTYYNTEVNTLSDYFTTGSVAMDYSAFYPSAQNYDIMFGAGETAAHANPAEEFGNASPPPYASYDAFNYDHRNSLGGQPAITLEIDADQQQRARSSSEEKELTPQQYRRKAQNRAAQRAFRERKERHVKELEQKLTSLEASSSDMMAENERLKRELQKVTTENQILRATSGQNFGNDANEDVHVGPSSYSPATFYANLLQPHANKTPSHRITRSPTTGERLLGAGATWDMIVQDPLFLQGLVDVGDVCERLKLMARCDGQGPVFEEGAIRDAIRQSAGSGKDELI